MPSRNRFVCIHGHFYQPPRENPWLESVETQESAAPYHDWNERITAECYSLNGSARIVDKEDRIIRIVNNYARMSYNFGPTLLSWMEEKARLTYRAILEADRESQARFGGHGSALAQVYNHIIMPLASRRDRETQILWGIADFERRFGRKPEGMWLAETAVDADTLDLLAKHGVLFAILAPHQCARIRRAPAAERVDAAAAVAPSWRETPHASVPSTRPYRVRLREGRSIAVFFYNGPLSRAIAFEGLLNSGDNFARRLLGAFDPSDPEPQIVHVATDGESYGHHHRHGEMALAYATQLIERGSEAQLTNYGQFLAMFPPEWEAEIAENTSWSCAHGVERWRANCGCNGGAPGCNQEWRAPLRAALDWLRDALLSHLQQAERELLGNPDGARNDYIGVVLDRSASSLNAFFSRHAARTLTHPERVRALRLLELERHALLMYTSCGWFFDELSGIETVQILAYAGRVLELAAQALPIDGVRLEEEFADRLSQARSNFPRWGDGRSMYEQLIRPMRVTLEQVAAHSAIMAAFAENGGGDGNRVYCYEVERMSERWLPYGRGRLLLRRVRIRSMLTEEEESFACAVLHFGDQNVTAAIRSFAGGDGEAFAAFEAAAGKAIAAADLPEVVRLIDSYFGRPRYSLSSLFADEQRRILDCILQPTVENVTEKLASIYTSHASLFAFLTRTGLPKPAALRVAAEFALDGELRRVLERDAVDTVALRDVMERARAGMVVLDTHSLGVLADQRMRDAMLRLREAPDAPYTLRYALDLAKTLADLPFAPDLWQAQNIWYALWKRSAFSRASAAWLEDFRELGRRLSIQVDRIAKEEAWTPPEPESAYAHS